MKATGIIAMIVAIVSMFIPVGGPYLTIVAAILAAFSAGKGLTFGAVALGLNIINIIFLSPTIWVTEAGVAASFGPVYYLIAIQIIAGIILFFYNKSYLKKQSKETGDL